MTDDGMKKQRRPFVGVGVLVVKGGKVLLGKRKGSHGAGTWCLPGGHLDYGETLEGAAKREVFEETGLEIGELEVISVSNDIMYDKHYITIGLNPGVVKGKVELKEPDKAERWDWFAFDELPEPLFIASERIIKNYLAKRVYKKYD